MRWGDVKDFLKPNASSLKIFIIFLFYRIFINFDFLLGRNIFDLDFFLFVIAFYILSSFSAFFYGSRKLIMERNKKAFYVVDFFMPTVTKIALFIFFNLFFVFLFMSTLTDRFFGYSKDVTIVFAYPLIAGYLLSCLVTKGVGGISSYGKGKKVKKRHPLVSVFYPSWGRISLVIFMTIGPLIGFFGLPPFGVMFIAGDVGLGMPNIIIMGYLLPIILIAGAFGGVAGSLGYVGFAGPFFILSILYYYAIASAAIFIYNKIGKRYPFLLKHKILIPLIILVIGYFITQYMVSIF